MQQVLITCDLCQRQVVDQHFTQIRDFPGIGTADCCHSCQQKLVWFLSVLRHRKQEATNAHDSNDNQTGR